MLALTIGAALYRFAPWMSQVFYGDDLWYWLAFQEGQCGTRASQILVSSCSEKFRPVASSFVLLMFNIFNTNSNAFLAVNLLLIGLSATLAYLIARRLSRDNWIVALLIALAVATCRFGAYSATQIIGPVESLALLLLLGSIYCVVVASQVERKALRWCWLAIWLAFLTILTHERYIVLAGWLLLVFLVLPSVRKVPRAQWLGLLVACASLPIIYISYKKAILGAPFLVGTDGTHLQFDPVQEVKHLTYAVFSIFGFNIGPEYLVGVMITSLPWFPAWVLASSLVLAWLASVSMGIRNGVAASLSGSLHPLVWPALLLILGALLLVPAVVTVRLEQRWVFASFVLIVLLVPASLVALQRSRQFGPISLLVGVVCVSSMALDTVIMKHFGNLYFVSSARFAEAVKAAIVDAHVDRSGGIVLVAAPEQCSWTLASGGFFRVYEGKAREIQCVNSFAEAVRIDLPGNPRIFAMSSGVLSDVTEAWRSEREQVAANEAHVALLEMFPYGQINSEISVSSPNGRGVFQMQLPGRYRDRHALVVVSGFSYRFDQVAVADNASLTFGLSMVYPSSESARAIVKIVGEGGQKSVLYVRDLIPPGLEQKLEFAEVSIPLSEYAGSRISLTFSAESPGRNSNGHWIGYAEPRIVGGSASH